jgi:hypothetical protein
MDDSMGKNVSAILGVGVVIATLLSAMPLSVASSDPPGCPRHSRPASSNLPLPLPVTHSCCQAGHDAAIVQKSANLQSSLASWSLPVGRSRTITGDILENVRNTTAFHVKPPDILALRI